MLFDKLCGIIERQLPQYRKIIEKAHLFQFAYVPHEVLPKNDDMTDEDRDEANYFVLPFDIVAIEDKASCVVLWPEVKGIIGLRQAWHSIEIIDLKNNDGKAFRPNPSSQLLNAQSAIKDDTFTVSEGLVTLLDFGKDGYKTSCTPIKYHYGNKDVMVDENYTARGLNIKMLMDGIAGDISRNTMTAIEEFMLLNSKERFIVEKRPGKPKLSGKQIPRAHQRPSYTLLTIKEIHETLDKDPVVRQARAALTEPHYRRRHIRTLKADKFKRNEDGTLKRIVIDPIWVGASEATIGQHKYVVRLDL